MIKVEANKVRLARSEVANVKQRSVDTIFLPCQHECRAPARLQGATLRKA